MRPDPESDGEHARLMSAGLFEASLVGGLVLALMWPIVRILARLRRG